RRRAGGLRASTSAGKPPSALLHGGDLRGKSDGSEHQYGVVPQFQAEKERRRNECVFQSITPEDNESLMMAPRSVSAAEENPVHVRGQPPKKTKASCPNTGIHMAITMDPMTPARPRLNL
ncbi:hypothetical protein EJB05_29781, partial [Eragrostis curvula]